MALRVMSYILYGLFSFNGTLKVKDILAFPPQVSTRLREKSVPIFLNSYLATIQACSHENMNFVKRSGPEILSLGKDLFIKKDTLWRSFWCMSYLYLLYIQGYLCDLEFSVTDLLVCAIYFLSIVFKTKAFPYCKRFNYSPVLLTLFWEKGMDNLPCIYIK